MGVSLSLYVAAAGEMGLGQTFPPPVLTGSGSMGSRAVHISASMQAPQGRDQIRALGVGGKGGGCRVAFDKVRAYPLTIRRFDMFENRLPEFVRAHYEVHEWKHASAILSSDFPDEWNDILDMLMAFRLRKSWITQGGGRKSKVSEFIDNFLYARGWEEKKFETGVIIDSVRLDSPTHQIDCFRNKVALEIEWNNKDPFFDRDLNNFRLLFDLRAVSVGVIITRCDELQGIFNDIGRGSSYGASTTHMGKLLPKIEGGGAAGCPLLVFGIKANLYLEDVE
jgi:hypothetical protein